METGQRTSNLPDPVPVGFLDSSLGGVRKQVLVKWLFTSTCNSAGVRAFIVTYDFRSNMVIMQRQYSSPISWLFSHSVCIFTPNLEFPLTHRIRIVDWGSQFHTLEHFHLL